MNQRNWRRKKSLKKPKKLGDESLSKMGCGTVQTKFTSISNKVAFLKINRTFKYDGRDRCRTCSAGDVFAHSEEPSETPAAPSTRGSAVEEVEHEPGQLEQKKEPEETCIALKEIEVGSRNSLCLGSRGDRR